MATLTIWKFEFGIDDKVLIGMPDGAQPLHAGLQGGVPCLWAIVDPTRPKALHEFAVRGTGHDATGLSQGRHIGTFQMARGALVFHVFFCGRC